MRRGIKFLLLIICTIFLTVGGILIYNARNYVVIRFDELGPLAKNMSAYYNGFKIGRITHIGPDKDFKHTLVKINFNRNDINLPQNVTVTVERFPNGELYLQFMYPKSPSLRKIKRGDIIEGISPYNLEQFMMGQSVSGVTDIVSLHIIKALNSADATNQEMKMFFQIASKLINENNKDIKESMKNTKAMTKSLSQMAENLNQTSQKLNSALGETTLKDSTSNIKDSTANIKDATSNIKDATKNIKTTTDSITKATKDIDKTMQKIDDTVSQVNSTAANFNSISSGLNSTLSKRFGGMRIIFGTPVKGQKQGQNHCK